MHLVFFYLFFAPKYILKLDDVKMSKVRLKQMGVTFQHTYLLKIINVFSTFLLLYIYGKMM